MFKIGEFSQMGQVSVRMLRHYDKLDLLKPNIVDKFTGYRYYTLEQLPRLNRILALKDLGLSLEEIHSLLISGDDLPLEQLEGMLRMKRAQLETQLIEEKRRLARVSARLQQISQENGPSPYDVVLKQRSVYPVLASRQIVPDVNAMTAYRCSTLDYLHGWLADRGILPASHEHILYHMEEFRETDLDTEIAIPIVDEVMDEFAERLPQEVYMRHLDEPCDGLATTLLNGSIYSIPHVITTLITWIKTSGYEICGPTREIHVSGRETEKTDFDNVLFEFQIPIQNS